MKKYSKPTIETISIGNVSIICASHGKAHNSSFTSNQQTPYIPKEVKDLYSGITMKQKAAAMNLMMVLGGSCPPTPACISEINKIMTFAGQSMGISGAEYKSYTDSFGGVRGMINELKSIHDKGVLDSLFLSFFSVVSVAKSEQALTALLNIYSEFGYTEEDCLEIIEKTEALSRMFAK